MDLNQLNYHEPLDQYPWKDEIGRLLQKTGKWIYQKAAKPESGSLGKLSSEIIIYFVKYLSNHIIDAKIIGGTENIDALLEMDNGDIIISEVKSAPLLTYPIIFSIKNILGYVMG
jgi:hypothetical protein